MSGASTAGAAPASVFGRVGLLPLYLKLYDDRLPAVRPRMEAFARTIAAELEKRGLRVTAAPVCRVREEFEAAVNRFEREGVDAVVTLHLAYSPSLESADALARTRLPVLVLDTTPAYGYGPGQDPGELMFNHGIHGVQDLCNLLLRRGKPFHLEAGHWQRSDVLDRLARLAPAAAMVSRMRRGRVGLIGEPFAGMGDFAVRPEALEAAAGPHTVRLPAERLRAYLEGQTEEELARERRADAGRFDLEGLDGEVHRRSLRLDLAIARWVREEGLTAFSFNFLSLDRVGGWATIPFLAASKRMAEGIGYAGEGDILTASFVGAVAAGHPQTSFTEMFCPDWENGSVFLSHMGEANWRLLAGRPRLLEMSYAFSDVDNPAFIAGRFRPGRVVLADLAPLAGDPPDAAPAGADAAGGSTASAASGARYRLILAPAEMLEAAGGDNMERSVRGWLRPALPLEEFLAAYSRAGGTHHLALSYTDSPAVLEAFGRMMGWDTVVLR